MAQFQALFIPITADSSFSHPLFNTEGTPQLVFYILRFPYLGKLSHA